MLFYPSHVELQSLWNYFCVWQKVRRSECIVFLVNTQVTQHHFWQRPSFARSQSGSFLTLDHQVPMLGLPRWLRAEYTPLTVAPCQHPPPSSPCSLFLPTPADTPVSLRFLRLPSALLAQALARGVPSAQGALASRLSLDHSSFDSSLCSNVQSLERITNQRV